MENKAKANIHSDVFQALLALVALVERGVEPFDALHEAQFVIQEVLAGRMDFDTVTPGSDTREPATETGEVSGQGPIPAPPDAETAPENIGDSNEGKEK